MTVPDFQKLMLPVLQLAADGKVHNLAEGVNECVRVLRLSEDDRSEMLGSGQSRLYNRTVWATTYLRKAGLLRSSAPGRFEITERGTGVLAEKPANIDLAFLTSRFAELADFRRSKRSKPENREEVPARFDQTTKKWDQRAGIADRLRDTFESWIPDKGVREAALSFLAFAVENADEERPDAWYLRELDNGLRLMTGRLIACEIARTHLDVAVMGPIDDVVRDALAVDPEAEEEYKKIPGALLLRMPVDRVTQAQELLREPFNSFVDLAMARVRKAHALEDHTPEAVAYLSTVVGRDLPQPAPAPIEEGDSADEEETEEKDRTPQIRGRAPIFELGQRSIQSLISDIEGEEIALPDMQRPFVWEDTKVRDLLESLFLGFPIGTLVLWHTSSAKGTRAVGKDRTGPGLRATALVIDGQQRLTSLNAVMRGEPVVGKDGTARQIVIAFRPRDGRFAVADAAVRNDPEYLPNITELWTGKRTRSQIRRTLLDGLRDKGRAVDHLYEDAVEQNLERADGIRDYRFPTVDIRKTAGSDAADASDEDVAEIFVRINNQGARLGQADFVLTLLSVFHPELRDRIEDRARSMSEKAVIAVDTQQLLRVACAVGFGRARMSAVYRYLRGLDPSGREIDLEQRAVRLRNLDVAADAAMDFGSWRDFLLRVKRAGFVVPGLIASRSAVINAYSFYVRGRQLGVPKDRLDLAISRWLFSTLVSARYSTSSETQFEQDLTRIAEVNSGDADAFIRALDAAIDEVFTGDYWTTTLVAAADTSKGRAPVPLAFRASQVVLNARALFGDQPLHNLLDAPSKGTRAASEQHHLFPAAWLNARGVRDRRKVNNVANMADAGWYENAIIGSRGPADYVPKLRDKLGITDDKWGRMCAEHALPPAWESLPYDEFLEARRRRMTEIIRVAFRELGGEPSSPPITPPWFTAGSEEVWRRIAAVERNLRSGVREAYKAKFGEAAPTRIANALSETERTSLERALRSRPAGADPLTVVDYLYLAQLAALLMKSDVWAEVRTRFGLGDDARSRLSDSIATIAPVRNEIAHVREVGQDRLLKATVACGELTSMFDPNRNT